MSDAIQSAIDSYDAGNCTRLSVYMDFLYLTPIIGVEAVLDRLPDEWRRGFTAWLMENFDNDIPVEEYSSIGLSEEELNMKPDPIAVVKVWLRARRIRSPS